MMTKEALAYYHAALNYYFFSGKLEPAVLNVHDIGDDTIAQFIDCTDPFIIVFSEDIINDYSVDEAYILTVLLHEMIHEYCYQMDICDIGIDGNHTNDFIKAATTHGLTLNGYKLTDEAKETITSIIENYNAVKNI